MFKFLAFLVLSTVNLIVPVHADELYLGAVSDHPFSTKKYDFNERHSLVAYERNGWIGGYFDNSYGEDTFFVGKHFSAQTPFEDWRWGVIVGASYGYRDCIKGKSWPVTSRRVCPAVSPTLKYTGFRDSIGLPNTVLFALPGGGAVTATFSLIDPAELMRSIHSAFRR